MKNKKSAMVIELMITLALLGTLLFVMVYGGIFRLLLPQLGFAGEKVEESTKDCDMDEVIGITDKCPCVKAKQKLEKDETCGVPDAQATTNCPTSCKSNIVQKR